MNERVKATETIAFVLKGPDLDKEVSHDDSNTESGPNNQG